MLLQSSAAMACIQHGGDDPEADERDATHRKDQQRAPVVGVREVQVEEQVADAEGERRLQDAVDDGSSRVMPVSGRMGTVAFQAKDLAPGPGVRGPL